VGAVLSFFKMSSFSWETSLLVLKTGWIAFFPVFRRNDATMVQLRDL
jgi:hypothetical protein